MEIDEKILSLNPDKLKVDDETKALIRTLLNLLERVLKENAELREENQQLKDTIRRLTGGSRRPRILPNTKATTDKKNDRWIEAPKKEWEKESKLQHITINRTERIPVDKKKLPNDAVSKGYRSLTVQDLKFETDNIRFLIERYYSPSPKTTFEGKLPEWVDGGFGPNVKSFIMTMHFTGRVTEWKIAMLLNEMGIVISEGEVSNIITKSGQKEFRKERDDIFEAGMKSTNYLHTDDTGARHKGETNHVMVVCTALFAVFFINRYKNSETVRKVFGLEPGELLKKILMSDNARQFWFIAYIQILCWVHEIRHYKNLEPWLKCNREALGKFRIELRGFWHLLKNYKSSPSREGKRHILREFNRIFAIITGYDDLDKRIKSTFSEKDKLLVVLNHPEIPLDNNEAERDMREIVIKRLISHGTRSDEGKAAWENMMTIMNTCRKNGVSFYHYVRDILSKEYTMPRLAELIVQNSRLAATSY
jgi:hypothetical protein